MKRKSNKSSQKSTSWEVWVIQTLWSTTTESSTSKKQKYSSLWSTATEETCSSSLRDAANLKTRSEKISFGKSFLKPCQLSITAIEGLRQPRSITELVRIPIPTNLMAKIAKIFYRTRVTNYPRRFCIGILSLAIYFWILIVMWN